MAVLARYYFFGHAFGTYVLEKVNSGQLVTGKICGLLYCLCGVIDLLEYVGEVISWDWEAIQRA
jgi:hypothetical protein